ncbi:MAG: chromate efflux transporter [Tissierellia bacterium]|nr:chromate efflux transporter [Tissierellia bacterium]
MKKYEIEFLKDVLLCSLGAYGGPEAHYGVYTDQLVIKKKYLTEEELLELIALTGILPGPSSTQTIIAIGYKVGGPVLGFLTLLVWALPVISIMILLSFSSTFFEKTGISNDILKYIGPMAVGFILLAAWRLGKKVIQDKVTAFLFFFGGGITYLYRQPWVFPLVLLAGGLVKIITSKKRKLWAPVIVKPPWKYLILFIGFFLGSVLIGMITKNTLIELFQRFYQYGFLVIGGGQVLIPYIFSDIVENQGYLSSQEFLTGFGLVQGLPGPMFSFSAYVGGMASRDGSPLYQIVGGLLSGLGIFLPGVLLIYFVYPIWEELKKIPGIKVALGGITAVAGGLITTAAILLMRESGCNIIHFLITIGTVLLLKTKKIPAPGIVFLVLVLGYIL